MSRSFLVGSNIMDDISFSSLTFSFVLGDSTQFLVLFCAIRELKGLPMGQGG